MAVLAQRFPERVLVGATGGWPAWMVTVVPHAGGRTTRHLDDPHPVGRWSLGHVLDQPSKIDQATAFIAKARGAFHTFRVKDPFDFRCERTGINRGRLTGSGTEWLAAKVYGSDEPSFEYVRRLFRIVALTDQVWRDDVLQVRGTDYTIDNDTGVITSASSWTGSTLEFACQFDVLCRFDMSAMNLTGEGASLFSWQDIDIVEEPEDEPE